jgi:membrane-bound ClpP family serine protease
MSGAAAGKELSMGDLGALIAGNIPEFILMLVGVGLLVFEMYLPGFGVPGILGSILVDNGM